MLKAQIPGYKIVRTLGQGGMATVYLAIQISFEREVALKVMSPSLSADPTFGERFIREARIVSRLVHPNIVTVYDVGVHEGQHFLSMEYVPGRDLKYGYRNIPLKDTVRIVKDVARALDFAGKKGYVHRDVKPENIMLHAEGGRAVLMDFGIARPTDVDSSMTQTGTAIGTPHYMSPEQAKGKAVDRRSDLYSLGVVLYLLLAGHVPFDADSAVAVGIKHVSEPIPRLPESLKRFQSIMDRALAKDPQQRYQNGGEFIADLDAITDQELAALDVGSRQKEAKLDTADVAATTILSSGAAVVEHEQTMVMDADDATFVDAADIESEAHLDFPEVNRLAFQQHSSHSVLPWLAGIFVAIGVATFVYFQQSRPQELDRLLTHLYATVNQWMNKPVPTEPVSPELVSQVSVTSPPAVVSVNDKQNPDVADVDTDANTVDSNTIDSNRADTSEVGTDEAASQPLSARVRKLRKQVEQDLSVAPELAQMYRDALRKSPDNQQAHWGLKQLRDLHLRAIRQAWEARDLPQMRVSLNSAEASFPEALKDDGKYQRLVMQLEKAERHQVLIKEGNDFLSRNALTSPAGANALERFRAVLADNADHQLALQGLKAIVSRYAVLSEKQLQLGEFDKAEKMLSRGLAIIPDDKKLNHLSETLVSQRQAVQTRQQQIQQDLQEKDLQEQSSQRLQAQRLQVQLSDAQQLMDAGQLILPKGESAFDHYRSVLSEHADNTQALQGLGAIEQRLVSNITQRIKAHELQAAKLDLLEAQERFVDSNALQSLQIELALAIEVKSLADIPEIPQVVVSNAEILSITTPQATTLKVNRTIYIGFRYQNFEQATSVVHAILYDGTRSLEIAQVPVIVSGKDGVTFFRIDRAVQGFAEGGYNIDLLLGGNRLITTAFKVENDRDVPSTEANLF